MHFHVYETENGKIAVFSREFPAAYWEEYQVVSLFRTNSLIHFGQFIGQASLRPFLPYHEVLRTRYDSRNSLFTVWDKQSFSYRFPFPDGAYKVIVSPSEEAAKMIFEKLVGIGEWKEIRRFFQVFTGADEGKSGRVALYARQKYPTREEVSTATNKGEMTILDEFKNFPKTPELFRGGAFGGID